MPLTVQKKVTGNSYGLQVEKRGDPVFQQAFEVARQKCGDEAWATLNSRDQTRAIYREMQWLDAVRVSAERAKLGRQESVSDQPASRSEVVSAVADQPTVTSQPSLGVT